MPLLYTLITPNTQSFRLADEIFPQCGFACLEHLYVGLHLYAGIALCALPVSTTVFLSSDCGSDSEVLTPSTLSSASKKLPNVCNRLLLEIEIEMK